MVNLCIFPNSPKGRQNRRKILNLRYKHPEEGIGGAMNIVQKISTYWIQMSTTIIQILHAL